MSKSTSILAVTASEGEFFSETASEFVDLLHFELGSAVDAKKVDVFDFISPTGSAGSFLWKPFSDALDMEVVVTA